MIPSSFPSCFPSSFPSCCSFFFPSFPRLPMLRSLVLGLGVLLTGAPPGAAPVSPVIRVAQVFSEGPQITAYLDLRTSDGTALFGLDASQLQATVGAHPAAVRALEPVAGLNEGLAYVFLVDVSRSLTAGQFERLRAALKEWIAGLGPADRAALLTFGQGVNLVEDFTGQSSRLTGALAGLGPTDAETYFHQGLVAALTLGQRQEAGLPRRRAIVTLTDGIDDVAGGVTAEEVFLQLRESRIPLYAIGFASGRDRARRAAGLSALGSFARRSGGYFLDASAGDLGAAYRTLRQYLGEQYRARLTCAACLPDGRLQRLQLLFTHAGARVSTDFDLRLLPAMAAETGKGATPAQQAPAAGEPPGKQPAAPASPAAGEEAEIGAPDPKAAPGTEPKAAPGTEPKARASRDASPDEKSAPASSDEKPAPASAGAEAREERSLLGYALAAGGVLLLVALVGAAFLRRQAQARKRSAAAKAPGEPGRGEDGADALSPAADSPSPSPEEPVFHLTAIRGPRRGERRTLVLRKGAALLGRAPECDLSLTEDDEISSRHCRLRLSADRRLLVEDLGSKNGTRVNGIPIQAAHPLAEGDVLGIGQTELRLGF